MRRSITERPKQVSAVLKDIGYTGACEIEYERDFTDNLTAVPENVGYFRGVMDAI